MKKIFYTFLLIFSIVLSGELFSQDPPSPGDPPPQSGGTHVGGSPPGGGGAPIGDGLFIIIAFAAAWSGKKIFDTRKKFCE